MSDAEPPKGHAVRYIVIGQISFAIFIGVCVALHPGIVLKWNEGGVSNYGIHIKTAIPYTLALSLLALYSLRAAASLSRSDRLARQLRRLLIAYSVIVIVMLFSTYVYTLNHVLRDIHIGFGTVLITFQAFASMWMFSLFRRRLDGAFLVTQLSGSILALITILGLWHFLFLAEELANTGFACLLIHASQEIVDEEDVKVATAPKRPSLVLLRSKLTPIRAEQSPDRLSS